MYDVTIIGSLPPPIGGVSVHVKRLLESIKTTTLSYTFFDLKKDSLKAIFLSVFKSKQVHLHSSNVYFRTFFILYCFILNKKLAVTYHGNLNRYGLLKNAIDKIGVKLAWLPIVINKNSFFLAKKLNNRATIVSAFIPPQSVVDLENNTLKKITSLKERCESLFATNAYNVSYDSNKNEIYQISDIVRLFNKLGKKGLIISDPSSMYSKLLKDNDIHISNNILILPFLHDFNAVLREVDCLIRFTTTDGDSLSVKESLALGKSVIATNVVDRPSQVILIDNEISRLEEVIQSFNVNKDISFEENGFTDLHKIYNDVISKI